MKYTRLLVSGFIVSLVAACSGGSSSGGNGLGPSQREHVASRAARLVGQLDPATNPGLFVGAGSSPGLFSVGTSNPGVFSQNDSPGPFMPTSSPGVFSGSGTCGSLCSSLLACVDDGASAESECETNCNQSLAPALAVLGPCGSAFLDFVGCVGGILICYIEDDDQNLTSDDIPSDLLSSCYSAINNFGQCLGENFDSLDDLGDAFEDEFGDDNNSSSAGGSAGASGTAGQAGAAGSGTAGAAGTTSGGCVNEGAQATYCMTASSPTLYVCPSGSAAPPGCTLFASQDGQDGYCCP